MILLKSTACALIDVAGRREWTAKALLVFVVALLMFAMPRTSFILSAGGEGGDVDGGEKHGNEAL